MLFWLLPGLFAALYGVIGGVEFLLPLFGLIDRSESSKQIIARWFSPVWEVTNVFFVAAITSFAALFPLALYQLPGSLRFWLLSGGALLAVRAALVLSFFYARKGESRHLQIALAAVSLVLPAAFSQAVLATVLPGANVWQSIAAALIGLALATSLCASLFFRLNPSRTQYRLTAQLGWASVAAAFLLMGGGDHSLVSLGVVVGCAALGSVLISAVSSSGWTPLLLSVFGFALLVVELLIRQWPYVIFGDLSYSSVQAPSAIQTVIGWGSVAGLLIVAPPLIWLGYTVIRQHRT